MEEGGRRSVRRWYALLILGLILHGLAMVNSDLGLDAHVRLNAAADDRAPGQDLAWDKLRIEDERVQEPSSNHSYEGYIPPWYSSAWSVKLTSFVGVLCTAVLAGLVPRWRDEGFHFDPMWSSLVLLSPVFLFVSGRGYDEGILACIVGLGVSGFFFHRAEGLGQCFLSIVLLATSTLLLLGWKGFGMMVSLGIWAGVVLIGSAWMWLDQRGSETTRGYTRHPWKMAATVSTLLYVAVFLFGLFSRTGTLSISIGMRFDRIRARWSARESAVGGARGVMERLTRVSWTLGGPNSIFGAIGTRKDDDDDRRANDGVDENGQGAEGVSRREDDDRDATRRVGDATGAIGRVQGCGG